MTCCLTPLRSKALSTKKLTKSCRAFSHFYFFVVAAFCFFCKTRHPTTRIILLFNNKKDAQFSIRPKSWNDWRRRRRLQRRQRRRLQRERRRWRADDDDAMKTIRTKEIEREKTFYDDSIRQKRMQTEVVWPDLAICERSRWQLFLQDYAWATFGKNNFFKLEHLATLLETHKCNNNCCDWC